jgi:hypothetical protein
MYNNEKIHETDINSLFYGLAFRGLDVIRPDRMDVRAM